MKVYKSAELLQIELKNLSKSGASIGFVPTMGALHAGHLSLLERAKAENDTVVCSIFVNPKQFNVTSDLTNYPKPIEKDMEMLIKAGVDYLFNPEVSDIYNNQYSDLPIPLNGLDIILEGKQRPGHFQGVAKVVKRLFEIVLPSKAYFGQKDFQQTVVIQHLISNYFPAIELVVCPIIREQHGLAMSSRNERLPAKQRLMAAFVYKALLKLKERSNFQTIDQSVESTKLFLESIEGATLEYLVAVNGNTLEEVHSLAEANYVAALVVVKYGGVRLLDNIILKA